jgi:hypothetical protein
MGGRPLTNHPFGRLRWRCEVNTESVRWEISCDNGKELNWLELLPVATFGINGVEPACSTIRELGEKAASSSVSRLTIRKYSKKYVCSGNKHH